MINVLKSSYKNFKLKFGDKMTEKRIELIKSIFKNSSYVLKTSKLRSLGISSRDIKELLGKNHIIKLKTGYYFWNEKLGDFSDFEIAKILIPRGVISVFSSANILELTTQNPMAICITIPTSYLKPVLPKYPPIEIFYSSDKNIGLGVIDFKSENMILPMYNAERTICDLFKYNDKISNDVALEALKNYMKRNDKNLQQLLDYAKKLRVKKKIKMYAEAMI